MGIGYHFLVRKDGSVYRGRPEDMVGAHAGNNNYARRKPVVEEQIKVINHRIADLEAK